MQILATILRDAQSSDVEIDSNCKPAYYFGTFKFEVTTIGYDSSGNQIHQAIKVNALPKQIAKIIKAVEREGNAVSMQ